MVCKASERDEATRFGDSIRVKVTQSRVWTLQIARRKKWSLEKDVQPCGVVRSGAQQWATFADGDCTAFYFKSSCVWQNHRVRIWVADRMVWMEGCKAAPLNRNFHFPWYSMAMAFMRRVERG